MKRMLSSGTGGGDQRSISRSLGAPGKQGSADCNAQFTTLNSQIETIIVKVVAMLIITFIMCVQ